MAKGPRSHYVVPTPSGGWDVKHGGGERAGTSTRKRRQSIGGAKFDATKAQNYAFTIGMDASVAAIATGMIPIHHADDARTAFWLRILEPSHREVMCR